MQEQLLLIFLMKRNEKKKFKKQMWLFQCYALHLEVAKDCITYKNTWLPSYISPTMQELESLAKENGLVL